MYAEKLFTVRLCHLKKNSKSSNSSSNEEYGFNLKAKTSGHCHYIGRVDKNTPADLAGVKSGDKIIEINNMNIHSMGFEQIMQQIKTGLNRNGKCYKDELLLMVIDTQIDEYYNKINAPIQGYNQNFSILYKSSNFTYINVDDENSQIGGSSSGCVAESSDSDSGESSNRPSSMNGPRFTPSKHAGSSGNKTHLETTSFFKSDEDEEYQITFI